MSYQHLEIERTGHQGWLWLNRPDKYNALSEDMWADLPVAVDELSQDPEVRAIVVAGRGKAFTVGIDLGMLAGLAPQGPSAAARNQAAYRKIKQLQRSFSVLAECPQPVIAATHGYCLGAGIDLITACDIRLASSDSSFGIRETRMGLVADVGTLQRLPAIVAPGHVAELVYTGKDIDAAEAERIGLVNRVVPDAEAVWAAAGELAAAIAANSPLVVQGTKAVLRAEAGLSTEAALDHVALWNSAFIQSNDLAEAMAAHLEKRPPDFSGT